MAGTLQTRIDSLTVALLEARQHAEQLAAAVPDDQQQNLNDAQDSIASALRAALRLNQSA